MNTNTDKPTKEQLYANIEDKRNLVIKSHKAILEYMKNSRDLVSKYHNIIKSYYTDTTNLVEVITRLLNVIQEHIAPNDAKINLLLDDINKNLNNIEVDTDLETLLQEYDTFFKNGDEMIDRSMKDINDVKTKLETQLSDFSENATNATVPGSNSNDHPTGKAANNSDNIANRTPPDSPSSPIDRAIADARDDLHDRVEQRVADLDQDDDLDDDPDYDPYDDPDYDPDYNNTNNAVSTNSEDTVSTNAAAAEAAAEAAAAAASAADAAAAEATREATKKTDAAAAEAAAAAASAEDTAAAAAEATREATKKTDAAAAEATKKTDAADPEETAAERYMRIKNSLRTNPQKWGGKKTKVKKLKLKKKSTLKK